jgi:CHAD domain-containing protein
MPRSRAGRPSGRDDFSGKIRGYLKKLLKEVAHLDPDEEDERTVAAVHKMRVLSRRLDSLFGLVEGPEVDRKLQKALKIQKKFRKRLGTIRDWDVRRFHWKEWAAGHVDFAAVEKEIERRREKALEEFRVERDGSGLRKSVRRMEKASRHWDFSKKALRPEALRKRLRFLLNKILKDRELHEVRLDVKKLRYTLEGVEAITGHKADRDGRESSFLKEIQSELGYMNDMASMAAFLRELKKKRSDRWSRSVAVAVEKSADDVENRLLVERHRWEKLWPERRKRLKELGMRAGA